ncbi:MAG: KamA family protein [Deltaproteobacteria bacterium]|nr:KamA family protein [Deltaproteobacteria bacterium]
MLKNQELDRIAITVKSHRLLNQLLDENPELERIMRNAQNETEALIGVRNWIVDGLQSSPRALEFYRSANPDRGVFDSLDWKDYAAIRILDYIDNAGREFSDLNLRGEIAVSNPIRMIWLAVAQGTGGAKPYFFEDMLHLFRQLRGDEKRKPPSRMQVEQWMDRFVSGQDPRIVKLREENRERIINVIIDKIDGGHISSARFKFDDGMSREQKYLRTLDWWEDWRFHLAFAIRDPDLLNEMLGYSLDPDTMKILYDARDAGIPFFVNPYYLSLLHVRVPYFAVGADLAIRYYVLYSRELVEEFGHIVAWEKEDQVRPDEPNAAGWLLPSQHAVHRRYPEVAIVIPATVGRACGGLCSSCQRMFDFQNGNLNFDLDTLTPKESWPDKLARYMEYFEKDSQLRDILITGGDALMSSDASLKEILDAILAMAQRKKKANESRPDGEKYAELARVRLGTRMPVYLPQRVTPKLIDILAEFKDKAAAAGVSQFVIQTHFESPMEVTPEAREAIGNLLASGWTVTNQLVFTAAASRRGHTAKLRQVLNDVGVLPYYTFSVKGYMENTFHFAPNARAVQEQLEEKAFGEIPARFLETVKDLPEDAPNLVSRIGELRQKADLPFLATDRNVLNLPGVGKSLTYRVIGITRYGRRILEFDHDATRVHSPIIEKMGKVLIIESKSVSEYLEQMESLGENPVDYEGLYGYSIGVTEPRMPLYECSDYDYEVTGDYTNLRIES